MMPVHKRIKESVMTQFKDLKIGDKFYCSTTPYTKKSTRTAWLNLPGHEGKWFYFGQKESVVKR
jgi:hypothetical protein